MDPKRQIFFCLNMEAVQMRSHRPRVVSLQIATLYMVPSLSCMGDEMVEGRCLEDLLLVQTQFPEEETEIQKSSFSSPKIVQLRAELSTPDASRGRFHLGPRGGQVISAKADSHSRNAVSPSENLSPLLQCMSCPSFQTKHRHTSEKSLLLLPEKLHPSTAFPAVSSQNSGT